MDGLPSRLHFYITIAIIGSKWIRSVGTSAGEYFLILHFNLWLFSRFSPAAFILLIYYVGAECGSDELHYTFSLESVLVLNKSHMHTDNGGVSYEQSSCTWRSGGAQLIRVESRLE